MTISRSSSSPSVSVIGTLLLIVIVAAAAYFRFAGLNWDENQHLHPDERFLTMVETDIFPIGSAPISVAEAQQYASAELRARLQHCKEWGGYFDTACSPLNPANRGHGYYVYGTLPLLLTRYVGQALHQTGYDQIFLVGRALSALADIITLLLLFAIAERLYGEKVALLAAALYAAAALPIQQAHFFTVDNFAVLFVTATFYFTVRAQHDGRWRDFAAAGVALGAAAACKISVWPLAGIVTLAALLWWTGGPRRAPEAAFFKLALAGTLALLSFRIFQPYAFAGPNFWNINLDPGWRDTMVSIQKLASGDIDVPFGHQWTDRAPIVFPWVNMVVWGLGLPLGLAAWVGWAVVGWQIARGVHPTPKPEFRNPNSEIHWRTHLLLWLWGTGFFLYQGSQWVKSIRYILPVYPFFIMFAAYMLANIKYPLPNTKHQILNKMGKVLAAIVLLGTLVWAWGLTRIYTRPVTRVAASRWIYQNVPTAATLRYQTQAGEQVMQLATSPEIMYTDNKPLSIGFKLSEQGALASVTVHHLSEQLMDVEPETLRVIVSQDPTGQDPLAAVDLSVHLEQGPASGGSYLFQFSPVALEPNRQYYVVGVAQGGPLVARSSALGNEHWDDGIPLRVDGRDGFSVYRGVTLQNYDEDDSNKLANMISWLEQVDYINLTSNRLYASIPRLPTRFPMTNEFYRVLFSGELGFEKAAEFTSYTTIGPFEYPDQESTEMLGIPNPFDRASGRTPIFLPPAEEAFSVYDHPRVVIYRKTAEFSAEKVRQILGKFDLSRTAKLWPKQATAAPTALMLDPEVWAKQQESGTWSQLYNRLNLLNHFPLLGIVAWWLLLALLGVLAWPIITFAWPALPDHGWGLARVSGLLIVGYLSWLAASLRVMTFGRGTILAAMLVLATAGGCCLYAQKKARGTSRITHSVLSIASYASRHTKYVILVEELVFVLTFLIFLLIRYGNGDLWHFYMGGERPMNFAHLNAILKTVYFPPYDPWFSGGELNYYYFGYVLVAVPIKLLGIVPALAYNIALPTLAALTALGAFSLAFNLFPISNLKSQISNTQHPVPNTQYQPLNPHAILVGLLAVLFVVFIGNLGEIKLIFDGLAEMGRPDVRSTIPGLAYTLKWITGLLALIGGQPFPARLEWWYWNASRILANGEIEEFPYFSFLYGDLHPHMIAFPLTLLMSGIGLGWTQRRKWNSADAALSILVGGLVVGAARANNTWDYPTYLIIALIALFTCGLQAARGPESTARVPRIARLVHALLSGVLGLALFGASWMLGGINDIPTFAVIAALLFAIGQLAHRLLEKSFPSKDTETWRWIDAAYIAVVGLSILYFLPYIEHYATAYSSVEPWRGPRSPLNEYILIHGIFLFPVATYLVVELRRLGRRWFAAAVAVTGVRWGAFFVLALLAGLAWIFIAAMGYSVILIAGPLMALAALLLIRPRLPAAQRYALLLIVMAVAITFAVEAIVLRGDLGRMNMVFKFYLQVWIIFGVVTAVLIGWMAQSAHRWQPNTWLNWRIAMAGLIMGGLTYTVFATRARINDRFDVSLGPTLDAMEFMTVARAYEREQEYSFAPEYDALLWMQDNIQGTPVVAESAAAPEYRSLRNRVATYTGLPAIIGYNWHEKQQRSILSAEVVDQRVMDVNELYSTLDITRALDIISRYNVRYIVAGYPEKLYYPQQGMAKFDLMASTGQLRVAFTNGAVTIYEVVQ